VTAELNFKERGKEGEEEGEEEGERGGGGGGGEGGLQGPSQLLQSKYQVGCACWRVLLYFQKCC
jgi:hypothetical protein